MDKTTVLVDNTTLAGSGRILYQYDQTTDGGRHARSYYDSYPDAVAIDRQSTIEILTAVVLFDEICWDAASSGQEAPKDVDVEKGYGFDPWVYAWFPLFSQAHEKGVLNDFEERYMSGLRLDFSRRLSLRWVKERVGVRRLQTSAHISGTLGLLFGRVQRSRTV